MYTVTVFSEGLDRREPGSADCGPAAEEQADHRGEEDRSDRGADSDRHREIRLRLEDRGGKQ